MRMQNTTLKKSIMVAYVILVGAMYFFVKMVFTDSRPVILVIGGLSIGLCMVTIGICTFTLLLLRDLERKYKKIADKYNPLGTDLNKYFTSKKQEYKGPTIGS